MSQRQEDKVKINNALTSIQDLINTMTSLIKDLHGVKGAEAQRQLYCYHRRLLQDIQEQLGGTITW